jgi:hypothetical protein
MIAFTSLHQLSEINQQIIDLISPDSERAAACHSDVASAIELIRNVPPYVPPSVVRGQLRDISVKIKAARAAIDALPRAWRMALHAGGEIELVGARAAAMARQIRTPRRSGGDRNDAMVKRVAADRAHALLTSYGHCAPTSTPNGTYCRLTTALVEAATGREMHLARACAETIRNV